MSRGALFGRIPVFLLALVVAGSAAVRAQEPPTLEQVEAFARVGRTEEARASLLRWWAEAFADASRRNVQRGLWLRGRLTVDPTQAALDFRRLVIEYPGGPYSASALFRLAQASFAAGDSTAALAHMARLARDYPGSSAQREAEAWLAAAGPVPPPLAPPPIVEGDSAADPVSADNEVENEVAATEAPVGEEVTMEPTDNVPEASVDTRRWAVQAGAFSGEGRAEALRTRLQDAGFDARIVRVGSSRLLHVRIGKFASSGETGEILERLRGLGFTVAVVRDADREERVSR